MLHRTWMVRSGTRILWACIALGGAVACSGDVAGPPGVLLVQALQPAASAPVSGAPGRPLPVTFRALDNGYRPMAGAQVRWTVTGTGSRLESAATVTDGDGIFTAVWVLGTRASEVQELRAEVTWPDRAGVIDLKAAAVPSEVAAISIAPDTTAVFFGTPRVLRVVATDPFGNRFAPTNVRFTSLDTTIVTIDSLGTLRSRDSGFAQVVVTAAGVAGTGVVRVVQTVSAIGVDHDTLRFASLHQIDTLKAWVVDDQGRTIRGLLPLVELEDSSVARVHAVAPLTVTALRNGTTIMHLQAENISRQVVILVLQEPASIEATVLSPAPIVTLPPGSLVPLQCRVLDAMGYAIATEPSVTVSGSGVLTASGCSDVRVQRSGLDTVRLSSAAAVLALPVAVAVPPAVSSPMGEFLQVDSLPPGEPWAPSMRRNSRGQFELYFAQGRGDGSGRDYEDLHRLVSEDGITFRYDGLVFQHDAKSCSLTGFGFENVAVVPRQDAAGWRMYVAAGQFDCYGWQVFSAVSTDERNWTLEQGVRLPDGQSAVPQLKIPPPYWPTGEGMVVDRLPSGGWRMLLGAYEHLNPYEDRFQIIEWDSPDQANWTYQGPVLSTRQMPAAGDGNVYSPTIRQVAPGLWRMIFTADNRPASGWRSGLWSAVSTDLENWQVEGRLLGSDTTQLYYASMVDDRVVFIRVDDGGVRRLAIATVLMP
jgi:hypothetical protein